MWRADERATAQPCGGHHNNVARRSVAAPEVHCDLRPADTRAARRIKPIGRAVHADSTRRERMATSF